MGNKSEKGKENPNSNSLKKISKAESKLRQKDGLYSEEKICENYKSKYFFNK